MRGLSHFPSMGGCASKEPETKASKPVPKGKSNQHISKGHPDFGLDETHDLVKFLGKGGHGEIWLFKDKATGEEVAVKLIKRPIPKLVMPDILREIKVRLQLCFVGACLCCPFSDSKAHQCFKGPKTCVASVHQPHRRSCNAVRSMASTALPAMLCPT